MEIIDDLVAEEGRIESILSQLDDVAWATPSLCPGWSICDVMLHLALTEEMAAATVSQPVTERTRATEPAVWTTPSAAPLKPSGLGLTPSSSGGGEPAATSSPACDRRIPILWSSGWPAP